MLFPTAFKTKYIYDFVVIDSHCLTTEKAITANCFQSKK